VFTWLKRGWTLLLTAAIAIVATVWFLGCSGESIGEALAAEAGYGSSAGSGGGGGGGWGNTGGDSNTTSGVNPNAVIKGTFTDSRDGRTYKTVKIGNQRWMAENLNYALGWCYNNDNSNCNQYGRLYDWSTAMGISTSYNDNKWGGSGVKRQGVCPAGWHLPSNQEWNDLVSVVGSPAGTKLKSTSSWNGDYNGTDNYGFSALPGGNHGPYSSFKYVGNSGYWWMSTEMDGSYAYNREMYYLDDVKENYWLKKYMFSVRCVED